jgi:ABC-2 type transport system ATP-binding protein
MSDTAIQVKNLAKTYQTFKKDAGFSGALRSFFHREMIPVYAVKPTSFVIKKGEFVGLLGPNGAGKTTMLKMMTGLIPPTQGTSIAFGDFDTSRRPKAYLRRIGMVMGQRNQLHPDLPAIDSFRLSQAIYDIPEARFQGRLDQCLKLFEIEEKLNIPVRKLSLGERMKMELILAILHEPELLFLDEPTIGLDFNAARQIRTFLAEANKKFGITIILTSHYTKDIEELCRRVILVNHGRTVYDGPLDGLDERIQGERQFSIAMADAASARELVAWVKSRPDLTLMASETIHESPQEKPDEQTTVDFAVTTRLAPEVAKSLFETTNASSIRDLAIGERSLEDIFAEIYRRSPEASSQHNETASP